MCEIYVKADPIRYESRSHSVRIHGVVTTVRLENEFWTLLGEMAQLEGVTTNQLIGTLYDEVTKFRGEFENFSSFLRVSCARYLALKKNVSTNRQPENSPNLTVLTKRNSS
jgi:predicted DNA-binding ribbon-helix-helix protein